MIKKIIGWTILTIMALGIILAFKWAGVPMLQFFLALGITLVCGCLFALGFWLIMS